MSAQIEFSEDSAHTIILKDFHEKTEGEFAVVTYALPDGVGYQTDVRPLSLEGVVAFAANAEPLVAERIAVGRAIEVYNRIVAEFAAEAATE